MDKEEGNHEKNNIKNDSSNTYSHNFDAGKYLYSIIKTLNKNLPFYEIRFLEGKKH